MACVNHPTHRGRQRFGDPRNSPRTFPSFASHLLTDQKKKKATTAQCAKMLCLGSRFRRDYADAATRFALSITTPFIRPASRHTMPRSSTRSRVPEAGTGKLNRAAPDRWRQSLDTKGLPLGMSVACCAVPFSPRISSNLCLRAVRPLK